MRSIIAVFLLFAIVLVSCKEEGPCGTFQKCSEKADESIRTISYCARTEDGGYETKKAAPKCWRHFSKCMQMNPNQDVILHKGECSNCTMENVCRLNVERGRMNKGKKRLGGIWRRPVCNADGEKEFATLCEFHKARCEANVNEDEDIPQGSICKVTTCQKLNECLKSKPGRMGTMDYCAKTEDGNETKKMPRKCIKIALACIHSEPEQEMMLHLGECKNCDEENVCLSKTDLREYQIGGRGKVMNKMKHLVWMKPICKADGEKLFDDLCGYHMARCEAVKDDKPLPEGGGN
ncbi:uncharacterized protein [Clytia hemisphaerica]|uniref:Kazal-like domain-containing protein n=1 Tax=Clytia hemisphaerica TaxID=252671 RepID=A0A7M5UHG3_9CNID